MKITKYNYEKYAIDYLENNLDSKTLAKFENFIKENPEIAEELRELQDSFYLEHKNFVFEDKFILKQSPFESIPYKDYLMISDIENTISEEEKQELENLKKNNPKINKEFETYLKTKVRENPVVFENKFLLKLSPIEDLEYLDYLMISDIENTISESEKLELEELKKNNPQIEKDYQTYTKTIAQKKQIVFGDKNSLKRSNRFYLSTFISIAVAATVLIFWGIFLNSNKKMNAIAPESYTMYFNTRNVEIPLNQNRKNIIFHSSSIAVDTNNIIKNNEPNYKVVVAENLDSLQKNIYITSNEINCQNISEAMQKIIYNDTRKRNQELFNNINPVVVINALFKGYEAATENEDLNLKLAYDKNEKQLNLEVKNKIYEVEMH